MNRSIAHASIISFFDHVTVLGLLIPLKCNALREACDYRACDYRTHPSSLCSAERHYRFQSHVTHRRFSSAHDPNLSV